MNNSPEKILKKQSGIVLIIVVFLIFLMAALMISLNWLHRSDLEIVTNQVEDQASFYCAEYGIERTLYQIRTNLGQPVPNWPPGNPYSGTFWSDQACRTSAALTDLGYTYTVQITETRADPNDASAYHYLWITSTGKAGRFQRSIRVLVRRSKTAQLIVGAQNCYYAQIIQYQGI